MTNDQLPIAIIGAGPVGLAAAAHVVERGLEPLILEASSDVAASVRDWGHVRLFSPWRYNIDRGAARLLEAAGWTPPPPDALPSGAELHQLYLRPLSNVPGIRRHLHLDRKVIAIGRAGIGKVRTKGRAAAPFLIRALGGDGGSHELRARAVIDASGTWWTPNPVGASGLPAVGEVSLRHRIHSGIPDVVARDRERYIGATTLVVGAGHSAANTILALAQLAQTHPATSIIWATRGSNLTRVFGGGDADALPARGQIGTQLQRLVEEHRLTVLRELAIESLEEVAGKLRVSGTRGHEPFTISGIDSIVAATGQRPDLTILGELRLAIDPALESVNQLAPLIDPNEHSCGTVRPHGARELGHPEPGLFVIGSKSYGRAPTFLLATGYEQARSVVAALAGDDAAAARVELDLPETGVCSSDPTADSATCCAPTSAACCPSGDCGEQVAKEAVS